MFWVITVSSELPISFKLDFWAATCKQGKNETKPRTAYFAISYIKMQKQDWSIYLVSFWHEELTSTIARTLSEKWLNTPVFTGNIFWLHILVLLTSDDKFSCPSANISL